MELFEYVQFENDAANEFELQGKCACMRVCVCACVVVYGYVLIMHIE